MSVPTFYHSGEIGDILYALKVIQSIGKGDLYCSPSLEVSFDPNTERIGFPNKQFTPQMFNFVKELVELQPYINKFEYAVPEKIDYNLNNFRKLIFYTFDVSFEEIYYRVCNVPSNPNDGYDPWLTCKARTIAPITVIRTNGANRTIPDYPWKTITNKYADQMVFVGTKPEYEQFTEKSGGKLIQWFDSTNLLSICEVINGAKLHMGNSTSLTVCAEGLKKNIIFEEADKRKDNNLALYHEFGRTNRFNVFADELDVFTIMEKIEQFVS